MGGMEFTWKMASVLVWPVVVLVLGVIFRRAIAAAFGRLVTGSIELPGVKIDFAIAAARRDITDKLAEMPAPPLNKGEVPVSLVDLYPVAAKNPRRGVRMAFEYVRHALNARFPELAGAAPADLPTAMRGLVEHGALDPDVEHVVNQLSRVLDLFEHAETTDDTQRRSVEFIGLTEGAIHALLRSGPVQAGSRTDRTARHDVAPQSIIGSWSGSYVASNGVTTITMAISHMDGETFKGEMSYPETGRRTRIAGDVVAQGKGFIGAAPQAGGINIMWREFKIRELPTHLDFDGAYSATVLERWMVGDWRKDDRLVGMFQLKLIE